MARFEEGNNHRDNNYKANEPIFLSELNISGIKAVSVRQQMKKLTEDGRLKRFDTGIYYIPKKSMFRSGSVLSVDEVIRKKYLVDGVNRCGYLGGILFANQLGLTTQVPGVYEVYTNKATTEYRETKLANLRVILRKPPQLLHSPQVSQDYLHLLPFVQTFLSFFFSLSHHIHS